MVDQRAHLYPNARGDQQHLRMASSLPVLIDPKRERADVWQYFPSTVESHCKYLTLFQGTTFENGIRWIPDGTGVVYNDFGPALWKKLLVDTPPQKILERPDQTIFAFDWSANQLHFAMAVGVISRDVVLVSR